MIRIMQQHVPVDFEKKVRVPGNFFLASCPSPSGKDWKKHQYWRYISREMYQSYQGICAYTCEWFPETPAQNSIDHFLPKSKYPHLAYDWRNYRLATRKTNKYKDDDDSLVDPFHVQFGWFELSIPSCLIVPGKNISQQERAMIEHTISTLKLNDDDEFVDSRYNIIQFYINGRFQVSDMQRKYPFIASELERQDLLDIEKLKLIFKPFHQNLRVNQPPTP